MNKLALWVMRGRVNAFVAAAMLGLIPLPMVAWTSAAVVALVALRHSSVEALWPMAGALLVALTMHWAGGDVSQLGMLIATLAGSVVLANSRSLVAGILTATLTSALYLVLLLQWVPERFDDLLATFLPFFEEVKQASAEPLFDQIDPRQMVVEGMGLLTAVSALAALLLARGLQSRLYNPGGFRTEFHQLRLHPGTAGALVMGMLVSQWQTAAVVVVPLLVLPLLLAGLGLLHGLIGRKPENRAPLVLIYLVLVPMLLMGPGFVVLIAAAIVDSFIDFRKRIGTARP